MSARACVFICESDNARRSTTLRVPNTIGYCGCTLSGVVIVAARVVYGVARPIEREDLRKDTPPSPEHAGTDWRASSAAAIDSNNNATFVLAVYLAVGNQLYGRVDL